MSFIFLFLFSWMNHAQVGSTADSMGTAGVAAAHPTEATFLNPAGVSLFTGVFFNGGYRMGKSQFGDFRQMSAVIADSSEDNLFSGSVGYRQRDYDFLPSSDIGEKEFIATAAYKLPSLALGLRGYKKQTDLLGVKTDQYNGDVGLQWDSTEDLTFAVLQTGLFTTKDIRYPLGVLPTTTLGAMYVIRDLATLMADFSYSYAENSQDRLAHSFGVAFQHIEFVSLNAGIRIDDRAGETIYTAGFQFLGPNLKLGYAYQKEVRKELGEVHTFDISINL